MQFEFDEQKTREVIIYIANRIPGLTVHQLFSLLYIADKTSLEQYGRFITGDTYYAVEDGQEFVDNAISP